MPSAPANTRVEIHPTKFKTFTLDATKLRSTLTSAPREFTTPRVRRDAGLQITLPRPDGTFARFQIEEVALMEPGLAAKFPEIKTYRGRDLDHPLTSLQLDVNGKTMHAQILSPSGTWYVDPYWQHDGRLYMSYAKSDLTANGRRFQCLIDNEKQPAAMTDGISQVNNANSGKTLRTYRIAYGTSMRYSQYHGGTSPDLAQVMAAVATMNNRVSGVYEIELGIRMILVANEDLVIATATNPTPYSDTPGDIYTNPPFLDQKIGEPNYDIGHAVTVGSGGIAGLGVVCRGFDPTAGGSAKANGTTGVNPPVGDGFWIDFVAHEMSHQYGGNHTFNGNEATNCNPNQNPSTAYEPGSGSTILSYAGVCGADNLQPHSDPYWLFASLNEMFGYITGGIAVRPSVTLEKITPSEGKAVEPTANPGSGTLNPTGPDLTWTGTAAGGASADESTCVEGVNCDTFTLNVAGTPADWAGKAAKITVSWPSALDDYDIFLHKGSVTGAEVDHGTSSGPGPEVVHLEPSLSDVGTGTFTLHVVYFSVAPPAQQYTAVAHVLTGGDTGPAPSCAVQTATGNNPPTVDAGPDYKIPARTPFVLTALNGTDPDGDPITYCWEEADLGPPKAATAPDNGQSPILRSYPPTTSPQRTFPRFSDLLANQTQTIGEKLPTTTRSLNFRLTVRDHKFGGFGMDSMHIDVIDSGVGFAVTSPNTTVSFAGGSNQVVTWDVANTTTAPISTSNVNILLSTDATPASGDPTFPIVLAANTPNDGSQSVTIPMVNTSKARVMVQAVGNVYFDVSNTNFTITAPAPQLSSVVSRKTHGAAGTFDINLPLTGPPFGIECRSGGATSDYTIVFTFADPLVNVGSASISGGTVKPTSTISPTDSHQYILEVTGVSSGQYHTVTLNNVNGDRTVGPFAMGVLVGDTTGNGSVNSTDVGQTKLQSGIPVSATNFRNDVAANGVINSSDVSLVKLASGTALP